MIAQRGLVLMERFHARLLSTVSQNAIIVYLRGGATI
jgi:hypothetical protein